MAKRVTGAALVAFILGMFLGQAAPEPTDCVFILVEDWLKSNAWWLPTWEYWLVWAFNYYLLLALWYMFLLVLIIYLDITISEKVLLVAGLVSAGAVVGMVSYLMAGKTFAWASASMLGVYITLMGVVSLALFGLLLYVGMHD